MDIKKLVSIALPIIFSNEGNYSSVNPDDGDKIKAVSIGKIQWHANRALYLLKRIVKQNAVASKIILGPKLYAEILKANNWRTRITNKQETFAIKNLISTPWGKSAQDQQAIDDVTGYIKAGLKYTKDDKALIYFADCYNQSPEAAVRIANAAKKNISLGVYHAYALIDETMKNHKERRFTVYGKLADMLLYDKPTKTITPQSSENDICWLQEKLNYAFKALNRPVSLEVNGIYGQSLKTAVIEFYKFQGWKSDGTKVGIYGIARLNKY